MAMSRRDYRALALSLVEARADDRTIRTVARHLSATNPNFDRDQFFTATGYGLERNPK